MMNKTTVGLLFFLVLGFNHIGYGQEQKESKAILKDLSFDKKTGAITYELTVPSRVRIRIGIADGPLYRTLLDWQERGAGKHKEEWDGMDSSGSFKLIGREDLVFTFNYFTSGDEYLQDIPIADILPLAGNISGRNLPNLETNRMHKEHRREFCHEPKIKISLPKNTPCDNKGFYIIKDKIPVEISLQDEDRAWFRAERYSIHIFIDDVFVHGELEGYSPYTWIFDPKGINEGEHMVLVNLAGFNDHYGIASLPVYVKKEKEDKVVKETSKAENLKAKSNCPQCKE